MSVEFIGSSVTDSCRDDFVSGGRLAVHIISGGDDEEQRRDGDFLSHDERYARTDEYVDIVRPRLLRPRRHDVPDPRLRPSGGCD